MSNATRKLNRLRYKLSKKMKCIECGETHWHIVYGEGFACDGCGGLIYEGMGQEDVYIVSEEI